MIAVFVLHLNFSVINSCRISMLDLLVIKDNSFHQHRLEGQYLYKCDCYY